MPDSTAVTTTERTATVADDNDQQNPLHNQSIPGATATTTMTTTTPPTTDASSPPSSSGPASAVARPENGASHGASDRSRSPSPLVVDHPPTIIVDFSDAVVTSTTDSEATAPVVDGGRRHNRGAQHPGWSNVFQQCVHRLRDVQTNLLNTMRSFRLMQTEMAHRRKATSRLIYVCAENSLRLRRLRAAQTLREVRAERRQMEVAITQAVARS